MRSLKLSGLMLLMLASLAACSSTFAAAPGASLGQPTAQEQHLNPDSASREHGW